MSDEDLCSLGLCEDIIVKLKTKLKQAEQERFHMILAVNNAIYRCQQKRSLDEIEKELKYAKGKLSDDK